MITFCVVLLVALRLIYTVGEIICERDWPRNTIRGLIISLLLLFGAFSAFGQIVRVDIPLLTAGPNTPTPNPLPAALWLSNATVQICAHPATISSCTYIRTYTDSTGAVPCPQTKQLVQLPGSACSNNAGTLGNVGFWYSGGTVDYIVNSSYGVFGPYVVTSPSGAYLPTTGGVITGPLQIGSTWLLDSANYASFALACSDAVSKNATLLVSVSWTSLPTQTCAANLLFLLGNTGAATLQPASGQTLTLTGTITAPETQIFDPSLGTIALGTKMSQVPVEWYGAVGDSNGGVGSGTDNTAAFQACVNSISSGQCTLLGKGYRITGEVSITKSSVGIAGVNYYITNTNLYPIPPSASTIYIDSATVQGLACFGTDSTHNIAYNRFDHFTIRRTQAPTNSLAVGLGFSFVYGAHLDGVTSEDSYIDFYFHGFASQGTGDVQHLGATWGYHGFTYTGTLVGYQVDSSDGNPSNSMRMDNSFVANNMGPHSTTPALTTYGFELVGSATHDFSGYRLESATVDYGVAVLATGGAAAQSSDIYFIEPRMDSCYLTCMYISQVNGSVTVTSPWFAPFSTTTSTPVVDIEHSSHVQVQNGQFFSNSSGVDVFANASGSLNISNNDFGTNGNSAVQFVGVGASGISNNRANSLSVSGGSFISLTASTKDTVIVGNNLNGTATNGILIDCTSTANLGVNQIGDPGFGTVTNIVNDSCNNARQSLTASPYTGTLTYTSIAANSCQQQNIPATGMTAFQPIAAITPGSGLGATGLSWNAFTNTNVITVGICNVTTSPITPSAVTWTVWVQK